MHTSGLEISRIPDRLSYCIADFLCDIASECNPGSAGQGVSPAEYVCSRYSAEGSGGADGNVPYHRDASGGCRFCLSGNEKDGSIFYRRYDVILEYDLQFFAAEGMGGREDRALLPRKNYLMPEKKVRLPKAVKLPMDLDF